MACSVCEADSTLVAETCPQCGAPLLAGPRTGSAVVVDGTAQRGPVSAELPPLAEGAATGADAGAPTGAGADQVNRETQLVVVRPSLPVVLWQQPAVRAVARAGAGAVLLTLGLRVLKAWLARPRARRQLVTTALPLVADLLEQGRPVGSSPLPPAERGSEVMETFIYMRRIIRRR